MSESSRRDALKRLALAGTALGGAALTAKLTFDPGGFGLARALGERQVRDFRIPTPQPGPVGPILAIAKSSTDPAELVRRAVAAMGGMTRFVSRGDIVAIKPNIGWDRMPVHAANTNPLVVAEVVKLAFDAGAKEVIVTDASCNEPNRCFQRSGIWRAAYGLGATVPDGTDNTTGAGYFAYSNPADQSSTVVVPGQTGTITVEAAAWWSADGGYLQALAANDNAGQSQAVSLALATGVQLVPNANEIWGPFTVGANSPEPTTLALCGLGAASLLLFRRKK